MYKREVKVGTCIEPQIEVVNLKPNDVIVLHLNEEADFECTTELVQNLRDVFPNNPVIFKHPLLVEKISIVHQEEEKINYEQPFL